MFVFVIAFVTDSIPGSTCVESAILNAYSQNYFKKIIAACVLFKSNFVWVSKFSIDVELTK